MDDKLNEGNVTAKSDVASSEQTLIEPSDLYKFVFKRVLSDSPETRTIFVEGTFRDKPGLVILILQKEPFVEADLKKLFDRGNTQEKVFQNDIYSFFRCFPASVCNAIKITSIYPATEKHIKKYLYQPLHMINETPHMYNTVTLPYIQSEQFTLDWVVNILEHKSESERIVFEDDNPDTGFVLLPDLKWDGKTLETLYLLALPFKRGIHSLRDLTIKELPLLSNIYIKGLKVIEEKYSVPSSMLRVYLHYQPSFYHLHVHFTFLQYSAPGISTEKSHLLSTVIDNISLMPNYYQSATIPFVVKESDNLFQKYELLGLVKPRDSDKVKETLVK